MANAPPEGALYYYTQGQLFLIRGQNAVLFMCAVLAQ